MAGENLQCHGDGQIFAKETVATNCPTPGSLHSWRLKSPCHITWRPRLSDGKFLQFLKIHLAVLAGLAALV